VEALFVKGYSVIMAYEKMKEEGRFSCGYSAFCDYARGNGKRRHSKKSRNEKHAARSCAGKPAPTCAGHYPIRHGAIPRSQEH
jgi:hypothetical protein